MINTAKLASIIERQHEKEPFSGVIRIREKEETIFTKEYGFANRAEAIPNVVNTRFGTASGTKTFTSVAICQLVEKGLLNFDTLLKDCLDIALPNFDPAVSVHHLLTHSSGIPDYFDESVDDFEKLWMERPMYLVSTPKDFLPMFQDKKMQFAPGEKFVYNNAAYILLGLIIEQISTISFQEYVQENIFAPSEMVDSGFFWLDALPERTAYGYIPKGNRGWRTNIYALPIVGGSDGGAFVTAKDMERFWRSLMDYTLLSEPIVEKMLASHIATGEEGAKGEDVYYGYGIWLKAKDEKTLSYNMYGEDPGVAFYSGLYVDKDIQITVMGNVVDSFYEMRHCISDFVG